MLHLFERVHCELLLLLARETSSGRATAVAGGAHQVGIELRLLVERSVCGCAHMRINKVREIYIYIDRERERADGERSRFQPHFSRGPYHVTRFVARLRGGEDERKRGKVQR